MFDFVLLFIKTWKLGCMSKIGCKSEYNSSTYKFLCDVESLAYDLTKSVLIDAESMQYSSSMIVASLISISIEIIL
jgi:hypothetical protein